MRQNNIPIIDLAQKLKDPQSLSGNLVQALHEVGFVYLTGHGIDSNLIIQLKTLAKEFFDLPEAEKIKIAMKNAGLSWKGYFALGQELTLGKPDVKEGIYFGSELGTDHPNVRQGIPMHGPNQWPEQKELEAMKAVVLRYLRDMTSLGQDLMKLIAKGLMLDADYFNRRFTDDPTILFRIFNYPPQDKMFVQENEPTKKAPAGQHNDTFWGVAEHTDMGFLTILLQDDTGGLQVKSNSNTWIDAPPIENSFIINIGDMLEYWTQGYLKATLHRVRSPQGKSRLSFPFFFDPNWFSQLNPIDRTHLNKYGFAGSNDSTTRRWDGLDLHQGQKWLSYGDFVWPKISKVFPDLARL